MACLIFALVGPLTAYAQPLTRAPSETLNLRVPGTTVRFDLAKVEAGTVKGGEGDEAPSTDIGSMLVLTTELTWDLYDIFVYQLDEPDGTPMRSLAPASPMSRRTVDSGTTGTPRSG